MKLKTISLAALSAMSFAGSVSAADIAGGNGSFETVTLNAPATFENAWYLTNVTIGGWTYTERTPSPAGAVWFMGGATYGTASNGNYQVNVISGGVSYFLSTNITGLTPGNSYTVYFDARQRSGGGGNFDVVVDTTVPAGGFNITPTSTAWAQQSFTFTAEAASHILKIANFDFNTQAATATGAGLMVDNFSVVESPPADGIWTGADGNWSATSNWQGGLVAQGIDRTATFNGLSPVIATVDVGRSIGTLSFSGANHTIAAGAGNLTLDVTAPAVPTVTVASGITATISALLGGTEGMGKIGDGTLRLTAPPAYTGGTTVTAGTLKLELGTRAGTESFSGNFSVANGATLNLDNTNATVGGYFPSNFVLSGAGTLTKTNTGSIDFWTGSNLTGFTGTVDVQQGALRLNNIGANANMGQATLNIASGATFDLRFNANLSVDKLTGTGTLDQNFNGGSGLSFTVGANNGSSTFGGVIQNSSGQPLSLTKVGTGTLTLTGANTYTGTTTVSAGILSLSSATLNDGAPVVIGTNGKMNLTFAGSDAVGSLDIDGSGPLPPGTYNSSHPTYGSFFTGTGSLVIPSVNGTWTSTVDGSWSTPSNWSGNTVADGIDATATFNAGTGVTVTLDSSRNIGNLAFDVSDYTIAGANTLTLDRASTVPVISVAAGRSATISSGLAGNDGLAKTGTGTLVLSGVKSYTGGTTVTAGTLELSSTTGDQSAVSGTITVASGATLKLSGADYTGLGRLGSTVTALNVNGGTVNSTIESWVTGATVNLTGGTMSVSGTGRYQIISSPINSLASATTSTISGNLLVRKDYGSSDLSLDVDDGAAANDLSISGSIQQVGTAGVTKLGTGKLVLSGTNAYTGNTGVTDGTLEVGASGSLLFVPTGTNTTNTVSTSGSGAVSYLGTVSLNLGGANTTNGNVWNLFNLASYSGLTPAAVSSNLGAFTEGPAGTWKLPVTGAEWVFTESNGNLTYTVTATPYQTWGLTYGLGAGTEGGDLDNDGLTNFQEFAFGLIPNDGSSVNPITSQLNKATGQFSYQRLVGSGLTYTVRTSTTLATNGWTNLVAPADYTESVSPPSGGVETVTVTLNPLPTASKLFIQVRAQ